MKIIIALAVVVVAIVFFQAQGNPGALDDFATWLGDAVENGVRWFGGEVEPVVETVDAPGLMGEDS